MAKHFKRTHDPEDMWTWDDVWEIGFCEYASPNSPLDHSWDYDNKADRDAALAERLDDDSYLLVRDDRDHTERSPVDGFDTTLHWTYVYKHRCTTRWFPNGYERFTIAESEDDSFDDPWLDDGIYETYDNIHDLSERIRTHFIPNGWHVCSAEEFGGTQYPDTPDELRIYIYKED